MGDKSKLFIEASATYSLYGNYIDTVKDPLGSTVKYVYNKKRDNLDAVIDSEGNIAFSIYDELDTLVENYAIAANDNVEVFPLKGSTNGTKGTVPKSDQSTFVKDGTEVLYKTDGTPLTYDLSLNQDAGTISLFINTSGTGTRYLISSNGSDNQMLNVYLDSNDKVNAAVRGTDNSWITAATTAALTKNKWYSVTVRWSNDASGLDIDLFVDGTEYPGNVVNNAKDFTDLDVTIGSYVNGSYSLNGNIDQLIYSKIALDNNEIAKFSDNGRGNYLEKNYVGNKYTYENDRVKSITHNQGKDEQNNEYEVTYNFSYDKFGNVTEVKVGNQSLISHEYELNNGKLKKSIYGNGDFIEHDLDKEDRIVSDKYNGQVKYEYEYDANGNIGRHIDHENGGITYRYIYDLADRLGKVIDSEGNSTEYNYDIESNLESLVHKINNNTYTTSYSYDLDNKLTEINYNNNKIKYDYNSILGRLDKKSIFFNGGTTSIYDVTYSYEDGALTNSTTNRISELSLKSKNSTVEEKIKYTYDSRGNITTVTNVEDDKTIQYYYNYLNELEREDNPYLGESGKTIKYTYDKGGNILNKTEYNYKDIEGTTSPRIYNYQYGDNNWKDKLTSFDGKTITYYTDDTAPEGENIDIGNPKEYDGWEFTWQKGRQLATMNHSDNGINISYKYNASGIRSEKKVEENGQTVTTKYLLEGDKVIYEESVDTANNVIEKIYYTYSSGGKLISMNYSSKDEQEQWVSNEYFYIRNTQGDIIGLIDGSGNEVVEYTYDSWGKLISIKDINGVDVTNNNAHVGYKNPYRYRGYRYDNETKLYYLNSRYYNSEWGRFVNADALAGVLGEILSHNVFVYCKNNPINMSDPSGYRPIFTVTGEETNEMYQTSLDVMAKSSISKPKKYQKTNTRQKGFYVTKDQVAGIMKGLAGGIVDGIIEEGAENLPSHIIDFGNRASRRAGNYFPIPIPGMEALKTTTVMGAIGLFTTGASVVNNFMNYELGEALGRSAIDISVTAISIFAGAVGSPVAGMVVGTASSFVGEGLKNLFWGSK
ncbi:RHS repeat domain-containing protein [Oceanirhabdus sp. W0125-5]|uniref:RHS repeat domain-containing protein n=1 Tax=Oceanirhabdus sp. W0125-5 TaxID=2999116 RepID=UPI0022F31393|nr:RHS repeat-associated core domain-containing protein [Oceanirhabdus sp. W0125-5]WBW96815.1 hypothetical protein OW730_24465 [Oceanirhabdus sp. W0125-5]